MNREVASRKHEWGFWKLSMLRLEAEPKGVE